MEEIKLDYARADLAEQKTEKKNKWKRRVIKTALVTGLVGLVANTFSLANAIAGKKGVSEVSRYFPLMKAGPNFSTRSLDFKFIFMDTIYNARIEYLDNFSFYAGFSKSLIKERNEEGFKAKDVYYLEKIISTN